MEKEILINIIEEAWENRELLKSQKTQDAIKLVVEKLDKGEIRVAEKQNDEWIVNQWI